LAEVSVPSEAPISECSEVSINVTNQEGQTIILYTGVFLYGLNMASGGAFADPPNWEFSEGKLYNKLDGSYTFWDTSTWNSPLSIKAAVGFQE